MALYEIPNNHIQVNQEYIPSFLVDFEHSHYANLDTTIEDTDFSNWVVGLFNTQGTEVQIIGSPTKDAITGTEFRFYFSFTISVGISGDHFFAIYNSSNNEVKYQSNVFKVITLEDVKKYVFVQFRNTSNLDNFNYQVFTGYNSFFLDLDAIEYDYEYELQTYREQSTGIRRRQKNQKSKFVKLEADFFDEEASDAMYSLSDHDDILLNGDQVTTKTGYSPNKQKDMSAGRGNIEFYITRFASVNLKGS